MFLRLSRHKPLSPQTLTLERQLDSGPWLHGGFELQLSKIGETKSRVKEQAYASPHSLLLWGKCYSKTWKVCRRKEGCLVPSQ